MKKYESSLGYKETKVGWIPREWEADCIGNLADITTGSKDTQDRVENGKYPFFVRSQKVERIDSYSFEGTAVLTAGDGVGTGMVFHFVEGKFDYHQRVYKISDFSAYVFPRFFFEYFRATLKFEALAGNAKSTVDSLRQPMLKNFLVVVPPKKEQNAIVEYLDRATADIETAITRAEREIELLDEYLTRLNADVVTGKLDVRQVAAALPDVDPLGDAFDPEAEADPDELDVIPEEAEA